MKNLSNNELENKNEQNTENQECQQNMQKISKNTNLLRKILNFKNVHTTHKSNQYLKPANSFIQSDEEIIRKANLINYKMGIYLINNDSEKMTLPIIWKVYWKRVLIIFLAALIFNFGAQVFLIKASTVPSGLTGIPTLIQLLIPKTKPYFAVIYLAVNIPLFLFFGFHIKKSFTVLTILFMLFQIITNFFFTWQPIEDKLIHWIDFVPNWEHNIDQAINAGSVFNDQIIKETQVIRVINPETWPILVYCGIGALFIGSGVALTWKAGGSTGGTDIVVYYFSTKSKRNVAGVMTIVSFATAATFLIIYGFLSPNVYVDNQENVYTSKYIYFGMRELSTFFYILVNNLVLGIIYPKYKKVKLSISCADPANVLAYFKLINYWHGYQVTTLKSGYTGKDVYKVETVMLLLETKNIIEDLKKVDSTLFISITPVERVIGNFNTQYVDQ